MPVCHSIRVLVTSRYEAGRCFYFDKSHENYSYETSKKVFKGVFYKSIVHIIAQDITLVILKDNPSISQTDLKCSRKKVFLASFDEACEIDYEKLLE